MFISFKEKAKFLFFLNEKLLELRKSIALLKLDNFFKKLSILHMYEKYIVF
jgi:hypothetical protein